MGNLFLMHVDEIFHVIGVFFILLKCGEQVLKSKIELVC